MPHSTARNDEELEHLQDRVLSVLAGERSDPTLPDEPRYEEALAAIVEMRLAFDLADEERGNVTTLSTKGLAVQLLHYKKTLYWTIAGCLLLTLGAGAWNNERTRRVEVQRAFEVLADQGYLEPGNGQILIDGNDSLLFTGLIHRERVSRVIVEPGEGVDAFEIPVADLTPRGNSSPWKRFEVRRKYDLSGKEFDAKIVLELNSSELDEKIREQLRQQGFQSRIEVQRPFVATPFGLVARPEQLLRIVTPHPGDEIISLSPVLTVEAVVEGHVTALLVTAKGETFLVSEPRSISSEISKLPLLLPDDLPAGKHDLVVGFARSPDVWTAHLPDDVSRLPVRIGSRPSATQISYATVSMSSLENERRLARWVLDEVDSGWVELHSLNQKYERITDSGQLPKTNFLVQNIEISHCKSPPGDLAANVKASTLHTLLMYHTLLDDQSLKTIVENCKTVRFLYIGSTNITDEGVNCLSQLNTLQNLSINGTEITDRAVQLLAQQKHESLTVLHLNNTAITDESVRELERSFAALRQVNIQGTRVSPEAVLKLKKARPELDVDADY